jgi:hypothetical protein
MLFFCGTLNLNVTLPTLVNVAKRGPEIASLILAFVATQPCADFSTDGMHDEVRHL